MLFRRRNKLGFVATIKGYLWPKTGWGRAISYFQLRIVRLPGSASAIAAGLAAGGALSMTPFIGLHTLMAIAVAWVIRGNYVAAAIGTLIGNPTTFPVIWIISYRIGVYMLGIDGDAGLPDIDLTTNPLRALVPVMWPMTIGSIPMAIVVYFAIYWPTCRFIQGRKSRRLSRFLAKQKSNDDAGE